MSYQLLVEFNVKPEKLADFVEIMQGAKSAIAGAAGCNGVQVLVSEDQPNKIVLSEHWATKEQHEDYAEAMRASGAMDKMAEFLQELPVSKTFLIR